MMGGGLIAGGPDNAKSIRPPDGRRRNDGQQEEARTESVVEVHGGLVTVVLLEHLDKVRRGEDKNERLPRCHVLTLVVDHDVPVALDPELHAVGVVRSELPERDCGLLAVVGDVLLRDDGVWRRLLRMQSPVVNHLVLALEAPLHHGVIHVLAHVSSDQLVRVG